MKLQVFSNLITAFRAGKSSLEIMVVDHAPKVVKVQKGVCGCRPKALILWLRIRACWSRVRVGGRCQDDAMAYSIETIVGRAATHRAASGGVGADITQIGPQVPKRQLYSLKQSRTDVASPCAVL